MKSQFGLLLLLLLNGLMLAKGQSQAQLLQDQSLHEMPEIDQFIAEEMSAIKQGLINLLTNRQPATGGFTVRLWSLLIGAVTLTSVAWEILGLWRFPRWRRKATVHASWHQAWEIV